MNFISCIIIAVKTIGKMQRDAWYNAQAKYYYQDVIDNYNGLQRLKDSYDFYKAFEKIKKKNSIAYLESIYLDNKDKK